MFESQCPFQGAVDGGTFGLLSNNTGNQYKLNSWLGALLGLVLYIGTRLYAPGEEVILAKIFGAQWEDYCKKVLLPWL